MTIYNLRDSEFPDIDQMEPRWFDKTFDLQELTNLWVFVGYFGAFSGIAHTELCFEFADNDNVVASFEVRALKGERYAIIAGMRKTFELTLRWTSERDALLRRLKRSNVDTRMHMFEADITQSAMAQLFIGAADRTNELFEHPEWYHSVRNTCTTNWIKLTNEVLPGNLRSTPRVVLPGTLPKLWAKQGVIKLDGTFAETMAAAAINDLVVDIGDVPDFSARLHSRT